MKHFQWVCESSHYTYFDRILAAFTEFWTTGVASLLYFDLEHFENNESGC